MKLEERAPREIYLLMSDWSATGPGETREVKVMLNDRAFSYFDATAKQRHADAGESRILVGSSVEDRPLQGTISFTAETAAAGDSRP